MRKDSFKGKTDSEPQRRAVVLAVIGSWKESETVSLFFHFPQGKNFVNMLVQFTSWKINEGLQGAAIY